MKNIIFTRLVMFSIFGLCLPSVFVKIVPRRTPRKTFDQTNAKFPAASARSRGDARGDGIHLFFLRIFKRTLSNLLTGYP